MTTKIEGFSNRQKDTGWGYALAHLIPFVWIYYAITRRTITPFLYQIGGAFIVGFSIGAVSAIVNPNIEEDTLEGLGGLGGLVATPFLAKKGIDEARKFGKMQLENN
tara:strand:- start:47 stop:367 length:321 start_codon:yes stop_codon:yes gene_type:complete